ncbi:magnesium transporter [Qipengyuania marisflavi]|uniref:Magnesium transporter MgtE n=1 Tax=Qipengyuania marisflavi TaxID=2486356 RepID=A0A5S3PA26_9SPHN|nr:magnesium transporter [Qipengyuania marisflavi]TMM50311.1 magnesium transporter [Qipengyuania marisflavi]
MAETPRPDEDDLMLAELPAGEGARPDDRIDDERMDEENTLKPGYIRAIQDGLDAGDKQAVYELVEPLHPADIADLLELLSRDERHELAAAITDLMSSEVVAELNDYVREDMMESLPAASVALIAEQLDTDDAVQLIEDLDEDDQQAILAELDAEDRIAIETALGYPEETAGRLMSRDFVAVPEHMTVGQLIDFLRDGHELPEDFFEIFVVDAGHHPVGTCQLSWILRTPRAIALGDVMKRDQTLIPAMLDQEEVALMFQKYGLISAAVIDDSGRLVGQMTVDDVVHIISEEAGEDTLLLSGAGEGDINEPIRDAYSARVRWLVANLGTALVASLIIAAFGAAIEQLVALAVLMPIVASIGGNAGTQTMAVTVRAIATNQLTRSNTRRILWREMRVGMLNGATIALLVGAATAVIFGPTLGVVIALAMVINVFVAGMAGVLVPVAFERLDQDPAVASSVFVTMITDSMGFFAFLGLAVLSGIAG